MNKSIEDMLKQLPKEPGVYLMKDMDDSVIYVGKAINLNNRVRSYFRSSTTKSSTIQVMVSLIHSFEYIVTDSELEALVLENNLIKEYNPRYNTLLKDDKTYPYIKVSINEEYPRVLFSRNIKKNDGAKYYGPYAGIGSIRDTIELINKLYKLRTCNLRLPRDIGKSRPCLNYHIGQCTAPCYGYISPEEYRINVNNALQFLGGDYSPILNTLKQNMATASDAMHYEEASSYRDLINTITSLAISQKITSTDGEDKDVIGFAGEVDNAVIQVFFIRNGKLIGREHYYMNHTQDRKSSDITLDFVKQFYSGTPYLPKEIYLPFPIEELELMECWLSSLRNNKVKILVPKKGHKEKLVELANKNAHLILERDLDKEVREQARTTGALNELRELLKIDKLHRIEAYDISNTSGFANVGSMVVFENGRPKRSDYRKFKIKSVSSPDDYSCMHEILTRRFRRLLNNTPSDTGLADSFLKSPELILMDGGKGQVNIAKKVLCELNINITVCGMVKDSKHKTRGLYFNDIEIDINTHSEAFKLITRIQDEAHRFAIEYHKLLRGKNQVQSVLDGIPGVGPIRRKALMKHFDSIDAIKKSTLEDYSNISEIPKHIAIQIINFFKNSTCN